MYREIGSDFWQYPEGDGNYFDFFWWADQTDDYVLLKSGRNALKALCEVLKETNRKILIPAYTCETVIQPFIDAQWDIGFYNITDQFRIDHESIDMLYETYQPDVILWHSYFGFPTSEEDRKLLEGFHQQGLIIVEDITQALLSNQHLDFADYYIASLRKFFAIPEGGLFIGPKARENINPSFAEESIALIAKEAYQIKQEYMISGNPATKERFRHQFFLLNEKIEDNYKISAIDTFSFNILQTTDYSETAKGRKENYSLLSELLRGLPLLAKPILNIENETESESGYKTVPLYLPTLLNCDRTKFQRYMGEHNVYCPVIWPKPMAEGGLPEEVNKIYDHILCFPIDQRYGKEEMEYIGALVTSYAERN